MDNLDYRPRLAFETSQELLDKVNRYLPRGDRKEVLNAILEDLILLFEADEKNIQLIIGAVVKRRLHVTDILRK